ncbi:MAG: hypothetical protein MUF01_04285 [Bryobacterales bacterium]|jgi:hypothetical protein|nr:hypothetical protein [Bryobacterales bacterium]
MRPAWAWALLLAAVLACMNATRPASAQALETGTVIVVAYSKQRIVVAADSRASFMAEGFQDEVCKIAHPARKVLFAASGMVGAGDWYAADVAKQVAARLVADNPYLSESSLVSLAEAWGRAMAEKIRALPPQAIQKYMRDSQTAALFAGLDRADEVNMVQVRLTPVAAARGIDVRMEVKRVAIDPSGTHFLAFGRPQVAMEFLGRKTAVAQAEAAKWPEYFRGSQDIAQDVAIRLVELTGHYDERKDLVGGSTAAIRMDGQGGVRWLKRPASCY